MRLAQGYDRACLRKGSGHSEKNISGRLYGMISVQAACFPRLYDSRQPVSPRPAGKSEESGKYPEFATFSR